MASRGLNVGADPLVTPGTFVTLNCTHGTIKLAGTLECSHQITSPIDLCDTTPSCQFSLVGTVDSGFNWYGWLTSGEASVTCGSCLSTTLTVDTPTQSGHYAGGLTLDVTIPPCPTPYQIDLTTGTYTNSTNTTVYFYASSSSPLLSGLANLTWGNTTAYSYAGNPNNYSFGTQQSGTEKVFLDFLEPNTTYYYELKAYGYCTDSSGTHKYTGQFTSTWVTGSDGPYMAATGSYLMGTVYNYNGPPNHAGAGLYVVATCLTPYTAVGGPDYPWYTYGQTNSLGQYSLYIPPTHSIVYPYPNVDICQADEPQGGGAAGYVVCVANLNYQAGGAQTCLGANDNEIPSGGSVWGGYWNETVDIWAPQVVNFCLPANLHYQYVPQVLEFSNAPSGFGSYTYQNTFSTTTTQQHEWSVAGGMVGTVGESRSTSTSYTWSSSGGPWKSGGTLDWGYQYQAETGVVLFDAIERTWNVTNVTYVDMIHDGFYSQFNASLPADWMEPASVTGHPLPSDVYYLLDSTGKFRYQNEPTPAQSGYSGQIQTSTTTDTDVEYSVGISLSVTIPGLPPLSFSGQLGWSQTSSTSSGYSISWSIGGTQAACYDVFGEGGNPNSYDPTNADMIGVYYWAPVNGVCTGG
jgi:hypothetical protein